MRKDFDYIKAKVASTLPFTKYFQSGTLGSGLAILSRFPILSSSYIKFTLAGRPLKVLQGDFYVGKGCGSVCIDHPEIGLMDIYTTHVSIFCSLFTISQTTAYAWVLVTSRVRRRWRLRGSKNHRMLADCKQCKSFSGSGQTCHLGKFKYAWFE